MKNYVSHNGDVSASRSCIDESAKILDALNAINDNDTHIALIVNRNGRLLGTLTDGDIRRAFLKGSTVKTPVTEVMNRNFRFALVDEQRSKVLRIMQEERVVQVPVIDEDGIVKEILTYAGLRKKSNAEIPVVIMAGGQGKRLRPHTEECPKPMLRVNGKPILESIIRRCIDSGFTNFYISVNYLKESIIEYFGDGEELGVSIRYLVEDEPLGTAGSLRLLPTDVGEQIIVMNGDVLTRLDLGALVDYQEENQAKATMCVREHTVVVPFGVVRTNGAKMKEIEEKPEIKYMVNAGVYMLKTSLISEMEKGYIDMTRFLERLAETGNDVGVFPIHEYWLDIGRPETLLEAHNVWDD